MVNTGEYYSALQRIRGNLATMKAKGTYDPRRAPRAFANVIELAAKEYTREFGSPNQKWHEVFTKADRDEVAKTLVAEFEAEYPLGNYDHLLPKKYQR